MQVRPATPGSPVRTRDKMTLTCNGYCGRATHNGADAIVGNALVVTQKGGVERKNRQGPLMNLNLFRESLQSLSITQPRDVSSHRFSRAMQNYRSPEFLDSRQWLRNKMRCQVYKGTFPVCRGRGERERKYVKYVSSQSV